ncbi:hypothetical protein ROZALSC1DRAFT_26682 [Rozella allomycis CSF55]|nr:hypothetical protein ROZALSC1DRAFT_26682 [Rozella allomycis CSF55]
MDLKADIFIISDESNVIQCLIWNSSSKTFSANSYYSISIDGSTGKDIQSVYITDLNFDNALDVIVILKRENSLKGLVYKGNSGSTQNYFELPRIYANPFFIQTAGQQIPSLMLTDSNNKPFTLNFKSDFSFNIKTNFINSCELSVEQTHSFVDFNGDCLSDLFLICKDNSYQIWTYEQGSFAKHSEGQLPEGSGPVSFLDFDGNGSIDMIYPVCQGDFCSKANEIRILRSQIKLNGLCNKVDGKIFSDDLFENYSINELFPDHYLYLIDGKTPVSFSVGNQFNTMRKGNIDADGYPDLLITLKSKVSAKTHVELLRNIVDEVKGRGLVKFQIENNDITIPGSIHSFFFDVDENGYLDVGLNVLNDDGSKSVQFVYNHFFQEYFFLKAFVMSGACGDSCNTNPEMGSLSFGAMLTAQVVDDHESKGFRTSFQLIQTGYFKVPTPYAYIGLGKTNNYLVAMSVSSLPAPIYYADMAIIPNSKLILVPPFDTRTLWTIELYISPGTYVMWVAISVLSTLGVLAMSIFFLHQKEKLEDAKEKKRNLLAINFDAL